VFNRTGNNFAYTLWFNDTQTQNTTVSVSETYGLVLLSMMRGIDEAIR